MSAHGYKRIRSITVPITVEAAAFADGDMLHTGVIELTNILQKEKHSGAIVGVAVTDLSAQSAALSLEFFSRTVAGTFTINGKPDITDADLPYFIGRVNVAATDYKPFNDSSAASVACNVPVMSSSSTAEASRNLFMIAVCRGTPTYVSTSDLSVTIFVEQD